MDQEIWKDVVGYEGLYQVSNMGNVKRIATKSGVGTGNYAREEHMILQYARNGYPNVHLYKNNVLKLFSVHRLVAIAFIPNPSNLPFINHKDETRDNNYVDNLEWCTHKYNSNYGSSRQKTVEASIKPVIQKTLDGSFVKQHKSRIEANKETGVNQSSICKCCNGKSKQAGGYIWENA